MGVPGDRVSGRASPPKYKAKRVRFEGGGVARLLAAVRWRRPWNRLMNGLYEYWYYRGVAAEVGDGRAVDAFLREIRARASAAST